MSETEDEKSILRERIKRVRDELATRELRKRKAEERAAQFRNEAQEKAAELAKLNAAVESARLKLQALKGEEVRFREKDYLSFEKAAARVDPRDAVAATKKRLEELQEILDRASIQQDLPSYVDVHFNAYTCSFALSRNTTFDSLREEACLHWGVSQPAVLKNANDDEWKGSAIVQVALAEEANKYGIVPFVRLHLSIETNIGQGVYDKKASAAESNKSQQRRQGGRSVDNTRMTTSSTVVTGDANNRKGDETVQTREYIRQKDKEAWQAKVMQLSQFFHDTEYINRVDPDKEKEIPQSRQRYFKVRLARSCLWLLLWATTVGLCIATMVFRFDTATVYSTALDVYKVLGSQEFCVPIEFGNGTSSNASEPVDQQPIILSSGCGANEIVRQFGGFSQDGDYLSSVPPSQRMLSVGDLSFWSDQVLFPALGLAVGESDSQRLVSSQTMLLANKVMISYAQVNPSLCNGMFYSEPPTCPCYREYSPNQINRQCPPPFGYSSSTGLGTCPGILRPIYISDGCVVQTSDASLISGDVGFLSNGLRVVQFDFNLLELNLGSVTTVKAMAEISSTGLIVTSINTVVLPLSVYEKYTPQYQALVIVGDVFLFVYAFLAVWFWVVRPYVLGMTASILTTLSTVWNIIAVLLLLVIATQIGLGIGWELSITKSIELNGGTVQLLTNQTRYFMAYLGLSTVSLFLLILTVFKQLQSDFKTSNLFQTLHRSSKQLSAIIFMLILALASMSVWASLAWGSYVITWTSLEQSVAVLGGMIFGAPVDFAQLRNTQNTQLWISFFFVIWVGLVILILVQFLGAVVLDAYLEIEAVSLERNRSNDQVFWLKLLFSPAAWLEQDSVDKRNKKISSGFRKYFARPWRKFKRFLGL